MTVACLRNTGDCTRARTRRPSLRPGAGLPLPGRTPGGCRAPEGVYGPRDDYERGRFARTIVLVVVRVAHHSLAVQDEYPWTGVRLVDLRYAHPRIGQEDR